MARLSAAVVLVSVSAVCGYARAGVNLWAPRGPLGAELRAVVLHPSEPSTVFVTTRERVFRRTTEQPVWVLVSVGDFVWADGNGNGIQDPDEKGLQGAWVSLLGVSAAFLSRPRPTRTVSSFSRPFLPVPTASG